MENTFMTDRSNRTIYLRDFLFLKADKHGKNTPLRSASRVIEVALTEYFQAHGIDLSDDPMAGTDSES